MAFIKRKTAKKKMARSSTTFIEPAAVSAITKVVPPRVISAEEKTLARKIASIKERVALGNLRQSAVQTNLRKMNKQLIRMRG